MYQLFLSIFLQEISPSATIKLRDDVYQTPRRSKNAGRRKVTEAITKQHGHDQLPQIVEDEIYSTPATLKPVSKETTAAVPVSSRPTSTAAAASPSKKSTAPPPRASRARAAKLPQTHSPSLSPPIEKKSKSKKQAGPKRTKEIDHVGRQSSTKDSPNANGPKKKSIAKTAAHSSGGAVKAVKSTSAVVTKDKEALKTAKTGKVRKNSFK